MRLFGWFDLYTRWRPLSGNREYDVSSHLVIFASNADMTMLCRWALLLIRTVTYAFPKWRSILPRFWRVWVIESHLKNVTSNGSLILTSYNGATTYGSRLRSRQLLDNLCFLGALSPMCITQITLLPLEWGLDSQVLPIIFTSFSSFQSRSWGVPRSWRRMRSTSR